MTDFRKSDIIKTQKRKRKTGTSQKSKVKRVATNARKRYKMTNMTKREFYEAVMALENVDAELALFAENEINKMNERNAKRKSTPSKTAIANEPIKAQIVEVLTETPQSASEIAEKVGISTQKCSALLRQIENLTVTELKVKGKGKVKGYAC